MSQPNKGFDFLKDYSFENEFVKLCPLKYEHFESLILVAKEETIWTYFLKNGNGEEQLKAYIKDFIIKRKEGNVFSFAILHKASLAIIGITSLYEYNPTLRNIKMGHTWLGKHFWGKGLNLNVKYLLFEFIFEQLELERIGFGVHEENLRSIQALKKIGVIQEGRLRNYLTSTTSTQKVDLILLSLLKDEWHSKVKLNIQNRIDALQIVTLKDQT